MKKKKKKNNKIRGINERAWVRSDMWAGKATENGGGEGWGREL